MIHKHVLEGCSPTPLAFYLKALGILRLVSQQKDKNCRGAWIDDRFVLATKLTQEELETFFLEEYAPTAILDPWNGGSGFYRTWDEKSQKLRNSKNGEALSSLVSRYDKRWNPLKEAYGNAIQIIREFAVEINLKVIPKKEQKNLLVLPSDGSETCLAVDKDKGKELVQFGMRHINSTNPFYLSSITVVYDQKERKEVFKYPSLWGSGGNDGAIDYTARFMENLIHAIPENGSPSAVEFLKTSLFATKCRGMLTKGPGKVGQFYPLAAGGTNCTTGFGGQNFTHLNPWDFVLMIEGAVLFTAAATKRLNPQATTQASAPFSLYNQAAGGTALSDQEESQRGEQWMPLWDRFLGCQELQALLSEGRVQIGRVTVSRPVDMARAISRLGVSRGITSFQRFGYLERNGQANFAVPLERINVQEHPRARLIDEIAPWMDRLHRLARDKAPARLVNAERNLADAVFAALTHDDTTQRWQAILLAAVEIESLQATGTAIQCGPIPRLSPDWVLACLGKSHGPEERLALALGSAAAGYGKDGWNVDSIRHHWLPLKEFGDRFETTDAGKRLVHDERVVAHGRDAIGDLLAVVARRSMESAQIEKRHPQLVAAKGAEAQISDIAAWISGAVDVDRCVNLARAFTAVDWRRWVQEGHRIPRTISRDRPDDVWNALKLNALPYALGEHDIPFDPAILRRLETGDGAEALRLALRRLQAHGIRPALSEALIDSDRTRRYGSALAFPLSFEASLSLLNNFKPNTKETRHVH